MNKSESGKMGGFASAKLQLEQKNNRIASYLLSPQKCKECLSVLLYEKRHGLFCTKSCAASFNNKKRAAGNLIKPVNAKKISNIKLEAPANLEIDLSKSLDLFFKDPKTLKSFIITQKTHQCEVCTFSKWGEHDIPLVLDHVDGNASNNHIENLRLLCPNCDAQTENYKSKNKKSSRNARRERYQAGLSY